MIGANKNKAAGNNGPVATFNSRENSMTENIKVPKWFVVVAWIALLWNLFGVLAFVSQMMMNPEMLAELPQAQQDFYSAIPVWANAAFGIAVFGGVLGCIGLIMKKQWALVVLAVSLLGVIVQQFHAFVMANALEVLGPSGLIVPVLVLIVAVDLVGLALAAKNKRWIE